MRAERAGVCRARRGITRAPPVCRCASRTTLVGLLLLAATMVSGGRLEAGGPNPYPGAFASSADGRWYAIVDREGTFWLVKRAADLPARKEPAPTIPVGVDPEQGPQLCPDPRDQVSARGVCGRPEEIATLRDGRGLLALDEWAHQGRGRTLSRFDGNGREVWSRTLDFFFDEKTRGTFARGMDATWWRRRWWISADESYAVLVAHPALTRVVGLEGGEVRPFGADILLERFEEGGPDEVEALIDSASAERAEWLPSLARLLLLRRRPADSVAVRLLVVLGATATDDERARFHALLSSTRDLSVRGYGIAAARTVAPDLALEIVMEAVRDGHPGLRDAIARSVVGAEAEFLPRLAAVARSVEASQGARTSALLALGQVGLAHGGAIAVLEAVATDADASIARTAVSAMTSSRLAAARDALVRVLLAGGPGDEEAILRFVIAPDVLAVPALAAALRRHPDPADSWRVMILDALKKGAGKDLGADPAAWERWFRERGR